MKKILMGLICCLAISNTSIASDFSDSETSYTGATILEGDWDVTFENSVDGVIIGI